MRRLKLGCLFLFCLFVSNPAGAAPLLREFSPSSGPPGAQITLSGSGFEGWTLKLGDVTLPIVETHADRLVASVPPGARSGLLTLTTTGQDVLPVGEFTVTPLVQGTLAVPQGIRMAAYRVGTPYGEAKPDAAGKFTVPVADTAFTLVTAAAGDPEVPFFAWVTDATAALTLNAQTTAAALTLLHPVFLTPDSARMAHLRAKALADPKVAALAQHITDRYGQDEKPLETDAGIAARVAAAESLLQTLEVEAAIRASPFSSFRPLSHQPDPYVNPIFAPSLSFKLEKQPDGSGYRLTASNTNQNTFTNRPDVYVHVYEVDPEGAGLTDQEGIIKHLQDLKALPRKSEAGFVVVPGFSGYAKVAGYFDVVGRAFSWADKGLQALDLGFVPSKKEATPFVPLDEGRMYVVRAYSGGFGWGYGFYLPSTSTRIDRTFSLMSSFPDGVINDRLAFVHNIAFVVLDLLKFFLGDLFSGAKESKAGAGFFKLLIDATKAAAAKEGSGNSHEQRMEIYYKLLQSVLKTGVGDMLSLTNGEKDLLKKRGSRLSLTVGAKWMYSQINVIGKVAAIGSIIERLAGMSSAEPLQTALIVTGHPFAPRIDTPEPLVLRHGFPLKITGKHFTPPSLTPTTLQYFPTGAIAGIDLPFTANAAGTELTVTPPDTLPIGRGRVVIRTTEGEARMAAVTGAGIPEITRVEPLQGRPGTAVTITGSHFSPVRHLNRVTIGGASTSIIAAAPTSLIVLVPTNADFGTGKVTVQVNSGPEIPSTEDFTVLLPERDETPTVNSGGSITVNSFAAGVAFGNRSITLNEAVLLATTDDPTLIDRLSKRPRDKDGFPTDTSPEPYEEELVSGIPGKAFGDGIGFSMTAEELAQNPVSFTGDLTLTPGDGIGGSDATVRITGGGLALSYRNRITATIVVSNPPGAGVHFPENAMSNTLSRVEVESAGEEGVRFDPDARNNTLRLVRVAESGKDGVSFGPNARSNRLDRVTVTAGETDGVVFLDGARKNGIGLVETDGCAGVGLLFDAGSTKNVVGLVHTKRNLGLAGRGGVYDQGGVGVLFAPGSFSNSLGPTTDVPVSEAVPPERRTHFIGDNTGPGIVIMNSSFNDLRAAAGYGYGRLFNNRNADLRILGPLSAGNSLRGWTAGIGETGAEIASLGVELLDGATQNTLTNVWVFRAEGPGLLVAKATPRVNRTSYGGLNPGHNHAVLCRFEQSKGAPGVHIKEVSHVQLEAVSAGRNESHGIHIQGASFVQMNGMALWRNTGDGLRIEGGSADNRLEALYSAITQYSTVYGNEGNGVTLKDPGTTRNHILGTQIGIPGPTPVVNVDPNAITFEYVDGGGGIVPGTTTIRVDQDGADRTRPWDETIVKFIKANARNGGDGVRVENGASGNTLGGDEEDRKNLFHFMMPLAIGNCLGNGIVIDGPNTVENMVKLVHIGAAGYGNGFYAPNDKNGILIRNGASRNRIGTEDLDTTTEGVGNNFESGIKIVGSGTRDNSIVGTMVGWMRSAGYLPNTTGITVAEGAEFTVIGGTGPYGYNLISGNVGAGIHLDSPYTTVKHNLIGLNNGQLTPPPFFFSGESPRPLQNDLVFPGEVPASNGNRIGILMTSNAHLCRIGGTSPNDRNFFAINWEANLRIVDGDSNRIEGNWFGMSRDTAQTYVAAGRLGIHLAGTAQHNVIGGSKAAGNVINGMSVAGILLEGPGVLDNRIRGNVIGMDPTGSRTSPNQVGIHVQGAPNNRIGDTSGPESNLIAGNREEGILLAGDWSGTKIGLNRIGKANAGNKVGIRFADGGGRAHVGGEVGLPDGMKQFGNVLTGNKEVGIVLAEPADGPFTLLSNDISADTPTPIAAPNAPPPPVLDASRPGRVTVTLDAAAFPKGALVELFHNGLPYLVLDQTAPVQTHRVRNLASDFGPGAGSLTATSTDPLTGQTTALSLPAALPVLPAVQSATVTVTLDGDAGEVTVPADTADVSALPLALTATGDSATLESLLVRPQNGADLGVVKRVAIQQGETVLGEFDGFARAIGGGEFPALDVDLPPGATQRLRVIYDLGPSADDAWTGAQVTETTDVNAVTRDEEKPPQVAGLPMIGPRINVTGGGLRGDVDRDGAVNVVDAVLVLRALVDLIPMTPEIVSRGDVNDDGALDIRDAVGILRISINLPFP